MPLHGYSGYSGDSGYSVLYSTLYSMGVLMQELPDLVYIPYLFNHDECGSLDAEIQVQILKNQESQASHAACPCPISCIPCDCAGEKIIITNERLSLEQPSCGIVTFLMVQYNSAKRQVL